MKGFSAPKLHIMRSSAKACPDTEQVKQLVSQLPWGHVIRLLPWVKEPEARNEAQAHCRQGKAQTNSMATLSMATLPPPDSDTAAQVFKDPYIFDFLGTDGPRRAAELEQGLVLVREKNRVLVEYALGGNTKPFSVAEWDTRLTHALPEELQASLPTIEQTEVELGRDEVGG